MIDFLPLIVLALAAFRITRYLVIDTMIAGARNKFHAVLINRAQKQGKLRYLWEKLYDLTSCSWCAGFWVTFVLYWLYTWDSPADWNQLDYINLFAIAGIQGMLHVLEPGDE